MSSRPQLIKMFDSDSDTDSEDDYYYECKNQRTKDEIIDELKKEIERLEVSIKCRDDLIEELRNQNKTFVYEYCKHCKPK